MPRSVLVTDAACGLGLVIAQTLAEQGHGVAVTHHATPAPDDLLAVKCDVTDPTSVEEAFAAVEDEHGPVEIVVLNVGPAHDKLLLSMSDAEFAAPLEVNLNGAFQVARRAARTMAVHRFGRLIFIGSVAGLRGEVGQCNFAAATAGLVGFARSLARELGPRHITSNVVAPGLIAVDPIESVAEPRRMAAVGAAPVGRFGTPRDVAAAVAFLASDDAGYLTGLVLPVDGGYSMGF